MRNPLTISTMAVLLAAIVSPGRTEERQSSVTVYTSPEINLGEIDREIIDQVGAGGYINFTAFDLSDHAIIDALGDVPIIVENGGAALLALSG